MNREAVASQSADERCAGWWYTPQGPGRKPFIVMAHGIGATREMGLDEVASRFSPAGLCVLAFDYRHYGASAGAPRELLSVSRQKTDYHAALRYEKHRAEVDPERAALWGLSLSAGHVMALSAEPLGIRAVVAQQPFGSGSRVEQATLEQDARRIQRLALADVLAQLLRRDPVYLPLFGPSSSLALMAKLATTRAWFPPDSSVREVGVTVSQRGRP